VTHFGASIWQGKKVRLRGFKASDWEYFARFEQDSTDARSVYRIVPPRVDEAHRRETEELAAKPVNEDEFALAIETLSGEEMVGAVSTFDVDLRAGRFRYGLAVDRSYRRKGYATEAALILLRYMFDERRFHKCEAYIYDFNHASMRLHEEIGFTTEGRLREHEYFHGRHHDVIVMGITAAEYQCGYPGNS